MRTIRGKLTKELLKHTSPKTVGVDNGFRINTFRELVEQIAQLSYLNKDYLLFFRGQRYDYKNKANNSSFYPTIYRGEYLTQPELDYRFDKLEAASKILINLLSKHKIDGLPEIKRKKLIQWSILQHYEVTETPLIDVTQSLRVACSFAQLNNDSDSAYIYVFGLPYYTNRISVNSEHDLINVRLLSISPPQALRPYFQEGYLIGTDDVTNDYGYKNELDLNNRLIAKYEIPVNKFWGRDFEPIPENALYPKNDIVKKICDEIEHKLDVNIGETSVGKFLMLWTQVEHNIMTRTHKIAPNIHNVRSAILHLLENEKDQYSLLKEFDHLRTFRNRLVHYPTEVSNNELHKNIESLENFIREYK